MKAHKMTQLELLETQKVDKRGLKEKSLSITKTAQVKKPKKIKKKKYRRKDTEGSLKKVNI